MKLPGLPGISLMDVQVSLQRLLRLLDVKGRNPGFNLSSAVVPIVDVTRVMELDGARPGYLTSGLSSEVPEFTAYGVATCTVGPPFRPAVVQLFNPANSNRIIEITSIRTNIFAAGGTQLRLQSFDRALSDDFTAQFGGGGVAWPKRLNGIAAGGRSVAQLRGQENTAPMVALNLRYHWEMGATVTGLYEWLHVVEGPWFLEPGQNIAVIDATNNGGTRHMTRFDWREHAL